MALRNKGIMGTLQVIQAFQIPRGYSKEGDQFNIKRDLSRCKYSGEG